MWRFETCTSDDAVGRELLEIDRHRLAREQVNRNGVGGEGIDDDHVVFAVRRVLEREPRVAEHDRQSGAHSARKVKRLGSFAMREDRRIDLVVGRSSRPARHGRRVLPVPSPTIARR